ncbi:MAG: hypothetical protein ABS35_36190 [Kaistia sp. SCN 65-12]|nr:MAG: hypothetical protein ABS35_36190 [Kaistia sp. SCN 65-12]
MRGIVQLVACTIATLGLATLPASAANISYDPELRTIIVDGSIEAGDFARIREVFAAAGGEVDGLYLHSPGGDFMTAIDAGAWVREHKLATYASGSLCYSACAFLWLGGEKLYANGVVSLHMPFYRTSMVTIAIPDEGVAAAAWYLASLGYDRALMDAMLVVSSTESNEMFPVTGPNTALFHISYRALPDEGRYREAMKDARTRKSAERLEAPQ